MRFSHRVLWRQIVVLILLGSRGFAPAEEPPDPNAIERYVRYLEAARSEVLRPDRSPIDPVGLVSRLGTDPEVLARFVREDLRYEPTSGLVRGPEGTLAAGAGGDWDRAALLVQLLAEAGFKARYVALERTPEEAAALVQAFLESDRAKAEPRVPHTATTTPGDSPAQRLLARFGVPPENRGVRLRRGAVESRLLLAEACDAAGLAARRIQNAAAAAPAIALGQSFEAWMAPLREAARTRVEVQLEGAGPPRILRVAPDPEAADAKRLQAARRTAEVPAKETGRLTLRLVLSVSGTSKPVLLVEHSEPIADLFRRPMRLEIVPVDEKAASLPTSEWTEDQWYEFVSGFSNFQAIFRAGDAWTASKVFDLSGAIHDVSADGRIAGAQSISRPAGDLFGGLGAAEEDEEAKAGSASKIEALRLEIELAIPTRKPVRQSRLIYGGPRKEVSLVYVADILAAGGPVGPAAVSWMALDALSRNTPVIRTILGSEDPSRFDRPGDPDRMPMILHEWQLRRLASAELLLRAQGGVRLLGGPTVILQSTQLQADARTKRAGMRVALDVAFDGLSFAPRTAEATEAAFRQNLLLGVASTVLESGILRRYVPDAALHGAPAGFQEASLLGKAPFMVRVGARGATHGATPQPLAAWAIAENEVDRAIVLEKPDGAACWWSIDPATGATIGRGGPGEGQSAMEYLQITKMNLSNLKCMLAFFGGVLFGGKSKNQMALEWMSCMTGLDNPGGWIGGAGNTLGVFGWEATGGALAMCGDILGGAIDVAGMME